MNDIDIISIVKPASELTRTEKMLIEERENYLNNRKYSNRRYQKRKKLKTAAAKFISNLQLRRGNTIDRRTMSEINVHLTNILKLRHNWTDEDWKRAMNALQSLEKKYLGRAYTNLPEDELSMTDFLQSRLNGSKLGGEQKLRVLLNLWNNVGQELALQNPEEMTPTREHLLLLLTQNLKTALPSWWEKAVLDLIKENFAGKDRMRFARTLRQELIDAHFKTVK